MRTMRSSKPTLTVIFRDAPSSSSFFNSTYFSVRATVSVLPLGTSLAPPAADPPFFSSAPEAYAPGLAPALAPAGDPPYFATVLAPAAPVTTFVTLTAL